VVPVCALSLARGSAPLRRPRTATQGTRDCHEFTVTCAWMPRKNTRHVCSPHATARRAAAGVPGTGGPRSLSRAPPARSRGLRLRSPSCASRSAAPIVPDALRRRMAEPAAGGRDAVQLRQLARAQRGGAAGAAARRPVAQLEREYRTIIDSAPVAELEPRAPKRMQPRPQRARVLAEGRLEPEARVLGVPGAAAAAVRAAEQLLQLPPPPIPSHALRCFALIAR
jgi:hypothetical protein